MISYYKNQSNFEVFWWKPFRFVIIFDYTVQITSQNEKTAKSRYLMYVLQLQLTHRNVIIIGNETQADRHCLML